MSFPDLQTLFLELTSLDKSQRESRIDEIARQNPAMCDDLRSLLESHEGNQQDGLSTHAGPVLDDFYERLRAQELTAGDMVGPYEIVEKLGEGGFSIVYLARQSEPVNPRHIPDAFSQ